jgi:L-fuculose-phosphate aldolase
LQESDLLVIDESGRPLISPDSDLVAAKTRVSSPAEDLPPTAASRTGPSSEWPLHREIYNRRPDVNAVCHGHPPWATAFAAAGQPLTGCLLPEIVATLGAVPLAPYGTPGTEEVPAAVSSLVADHSALLLANHGVVTMGDSLTTAFYRLESVERLAQVTLLARLAGGEQRLTATQATALLSSLQGEDLSGTDLVCQPADPTAKQAEPSPANAAANQMAAREVALETLAERLAREILSELGRVT